MWSWTLPGEEDQRAEEDMLLEHHGQQLRVPLPLLSQACAKAPLAEEEMMVVYLLLTCCIAGDAGGRGKSVSRQQQLWFH